MVVMDGCYESVTPWTLTCIRQTMSG